MKRSDRKILVISHNSFSSITNNGKTLEAILQGFKKENISQLFFLSEIPDYSFCENYYCITDKDMIHSLLTGSVPGRVLNAEDKGDELSSKKRSAFYRVISSVSHKFPYLRDLYWLKSRWSDDALKQWCEARNPDIVFFVGGQSQFSHDIALFVSCFLKKPLVTFFTDDYLHINNQSMTCDHDRIKKVYLKTIKYSAVLFACCDYMASEYSDFFSRKFHTLLNTMEIVPYVEYKGNSKVVISYFGGLHLNRDRMIMRLAQYVDENCEIRVFSNSILTNKQRVEFNKAGVKIMPCLYGNELWTEIINSDILLHVESNDVANQKFTRLSLSTKLPEYMMAGRCILAYGPDHVSSIKVLKDNNIGYVISSDDDDNDIKLKLIRITGDFNLRKRLGMSAYDHALTRLNRDVISDYFAEIINNL